MNPSTPTAAMATPGGDPLEQALRAWAAPDLPDDGFTQAVLQRLAVARAHMGVPPAHAVQRLQAARRHEAQQLRLTGLGMLLGLVVAVVWLLVALGWPGGRTGLVEATVLWLGAALAGSAGAVAWLMQQAD